MTSTNEHPWAQHWTNDLWKCAYCDISPGQPHREGCATRSTTNQVVWFGPPITPGMLPRVVVEGDITASYLACIHCDERFEPGDVVFENRAQSIGLHGACVLQLAQMIPRALTSPAEVEAEFERRRAEIFDDSP